MKLRFWSQIIIVPMSMILLLLPASAKNKSAQDKNDTNGAMIYGEAGEKYELVGSGGIRVIGGHHGWFTSNMKSSPIEIDGSEIAGSSFTAVNEASDFKASATGSYFASHSAICVLPTAVGVGGKEIIVCNTSDGTITYATTNGETISGRQTGSLTNSTAYKLDRFISDGQNWFRE